MKLVVKIINLRYNESNQIFSKSRTLAGYSQLLSLIKESVKSGMHLKDAIDLAVKQCIDNGLIADFLLENSQEVGNMLFEEITSEQFAEIRANEAFHDGLTRGLEQGLEQGIKAFVEVCQEMEFTHTETVQKIMSKFFITKDTAENYIEKFVKPDSES